MLQASKAPFAMAPLPLTNYGRGAIVVVLGRTGHPGERGESMHAITGTVVADFYASGSDLLVLTEPGDFAFIDASALDRPASTYAFARVEDGQEVQVLLARTAIEEGNWFPDALDDRGTLDLAVADEMAEIITTDGILPGRIAKASALAEAWSEAEKETNRLALARARAVAEVVAFAGRNQTKAARLLSLDQSTVNKLVRKANAAQTPQVNA